MYSLYFLFLQGMCRIAATGALLSLLISPAIAFVLGFRSDCPLPRQVEPSSELPGILRDTSWRTRYVVAASSWVCKTQNMHRTSLKHQVQLHSLLERAGNSTVLLASANSFSHDKRQKLLRDHLQGRDMQPQVPSTPANSTWYLFGDTLHGPFAEILHEHSYSLPWETLEPLPVLGVGAALSGVAFHTHGTAFAQSLLGFKRWYLSPPTSRGVAPPCFHGDVSALDWALLFDPHLLTPVLYPWEDEQGELHQQAQTMFAGVSPSALSLLPAGEWQVHTSAAAAATRWACVATAQGEQCTESTVRVLSHGPPSDSGTETVCGCESSAPAVTAAGADAAPLQQWRVRWQWRPLNQALDLDADTVAAVRAGLVHAPPSVRGVLAGALTCVTANARGAPACMSALRELAQEWVVSTHSSTCSNGRVMTCTVPVGWILNIPAHWWHSTLNVAEYNAFATVFVR